MVKGKVEYYFYEKYSDSTSRQGVAGKWWGVAF
jgi:hypothetical protein